MRISDWSSDVCSSDLRLRRRPRDVRADLLVAAVLAGEGDRHRRHAVGRRRRYRGVVAFVERDDQQAILLECGGSENLRHPDLEEEIGRAWCRERVCQYV